MQDLIYDISFQHDRVHLKIKSKIPSIDIGAKVNKIKSKIPNIDIGAKIGKIKSKIPNIDIGAKLGKIKGKFSGKGGRKMRKMKKKSGGHGH